jgi:ferrochelatase
VTRLLAFSRPPVGLLLVNLGTPDAPEPAAVRRFLAQFLADPRVVELPRLLWLPILHGIVLATRPQRVAAAYAQIWDRDSNEGPLKAITRRQAEKLHARADAGALGEAAPVRVDFAMRYGSPAIASRIEALMEEGCERIVVLPLYPQYAASTTASATDAVFDALKAMRRQPALRFLAPYFDDPAYIDALAQSVREELAKLDFEPQVLLASFHGLPQFQIDRGDPYRAQCETTAALLREALGMDARRLPIAFQSRFGRAKWIGPSTAETARDLAARGVKRLAVVAPGFSADCLETIEELGVEIRDVFLAAGGENYARLPCLNDGEAGLRLIETIAKRELAGWAS